MNVGLLALWQSGGARHSSAAKRFLPREIGPTLARPRLARLKTALARRLLIVSRMSVAKTMSLVAAGMLLALAGSAMATVMF